MIQLASIHVYPIKSCAGIRAESWELDHLGLRLDRAFMVVDHAGRFVTQREEPALARVATSLDDSSLGIRVDGIGEVRVPLASQSAAERVAVQVWRYSGAALEQAADASALLSALLGRDVRLVRVPPEHARAVNPLRARTPALTAFSDGYPLLLLGQASLDDLNARLPEPLPMDRFRPNLVFAGAHPYAEDGWQRIRVGELELEIAKSCERCTVTTVDQKTGQRASAEPLRTLARYRRCAGGVLFGQNAIQRGQGPIRVGARIEVLASQAPPQFDLD